MDSRHHDRRDWLWYGTSNETKQALANEKRLKLSFPKEEILLIELYGNTVNDVRSRRVIRFKIHGGTVCSDTMNA